MYNDVKNIYPSFYGQAKQSLTCSLETVPNLKHVLLWFKYKISPQAASEMLAFSHTETY